MRDTARCKGGVGRGSAGEILSQDTTILFPGGKRALNRQEKKKKGYQIRKKDSIKRRVKPRGENKKPPGGA